MFHISAKETHRDIWYTNTQTGTCVQTPYLCCIVGGKLNADRTFRQIDAVHEASAIHSDQNCVFLHHLHLVKTKENRKTKRKMYASTSFVRRKPIHL